MTASARPDNFDRFDRRHVIEDVERTMRGAGVAPGRRWREITTWLLCGSLMTAGCASKEARTNAALRNAGLGAQMADCMAGQMAERLSVSQLRRLRDLGGLRGDGLVLLSLDEFLDKVRALRDPETVLVVTLAAGACRLIQEAAKPPLR